MRKVLILEDNEHILYAMEKLAKEVDDKLIIYTYSNARDAYEGMLKHKMDLFILDIILDTKVPGDVSGLYFAESVRKIREYKFTPLIFVTSLNDSKFVSYEDFHCYSFIEKPFDPVRVKNTIKECLQFPKV